MRFKELEAMLKDPNIVKLKDDDDNMMLYDDSEKHAPYAVFHMFENEEPRAFASTYIHGVEVLIPKSDPDHEKYVQSYLSTEWFSVSRIEFVRKNNINMYVRIVNSREPDDDWVVYTTPDEFIGPEFVDDHAVDMLTEFGTHLGRYTIKENLTLKNIQLLFFSDIIFNSKLKNSVNGRIVLPSMVRHKMVVDSSVRLLKGPFNQTVYIDTPTGYDPESENIEWLPVAKIIYSNHSGVISGKDYESGMFWKCTTDRPLVDTLIDASIVNLLYQYYVEFRKMEEENDV